MEPKFFLKISDHQWGPASSSYPQLCRWSLILVERSMKKGFQKMPLKSL